MKVTVKHKILIGALLNFSFLIAESSAIVLSISRHGAEVFLYYTNLSNYFAIIPCLLTCIFSLRFFISYKEFPRFIIILRYISAVTLTVTFCVSMFIIIPLAPNLTHFMLLEGSSFFQHLYCPIVSLFSFLFFERHIRLKAVHIFLALIPTFVYGFTIVFLNLLKIITGPYPFFYFYEYVWYIPTAIIFTIILISILSALFIKISYNKRPVIKLTHASI